MVVRKKELPFPIFSAFLFSCMFSVSLLPSLSLHPVSMLSCNVSTTLELLSVFSELVTILCSGSYCYISLFPCAIAVVSAFLKFEKII